MTCSVVIVTLDRPDCVRRCLIALAAQEPKPDEVIVVDSSRGEETQCVVERFPGTIYLRNERGLGHTTYSRNLAMGRATGQVVAFLDDDAYAHAGWLAALLAQYADPRVGAVGGRALNHVPGEETAGLDRIGKFTRGGDIVGYFAADPGRAIEVDHLIGCNMSLRRSVIAECGGFREGFSGRYCFREESDIFFAVKRAGYRIIFEPTAVVDHVGAPKPLGRRFDIAYRYYVERNHYILLVRNFGLLAPVVRRYLLRATAQNGGEFARRVSGSCLRLGAAVLGTIAGVVAGLVWRLRDKAGIAKKRGTNNLGGDSSARWTASDLNQSAEPAGVGDNDFVRARLSESRERISLGVPKARFPSEPQVPRHQHP